MSDLDSVSESTPAPKRVLFIFRSTKQLVLFVYIAVFSLGFLFQFTHIFGLLPILMIMAGLAGIFHLGYLMLLSDSDDYLDELHAERGGKKRKRVVFFVDN